MDVVAVTPRRQLGTRARVSSLARRRSTTSRGSASRPDVFVLFYDMTGQERLGGDLYALAVDPTDSSVVLVAWVRTGWADAAGTDWTVHVRRSTDKGQSVVGRRAHDHERQESEPRGEAPSVRSACSTRQFSGTRLGHAARGELGNAWATGTRRSCHSTPPRRRPRPARSSPTSATTYGCWRSARTSSVSSAATTRPIPRTSRAASPTSETPTGRRTRCSGTDNTTPVAPSIDPFFFQSGAAAHHHLAASDRRGRADHERRRSSASRNRSPAHRSGSTRARCIRRPQQRRSPPAGRGRGSPRPGGGTEIKLDPRAGRATARRS